MKSEYGLEYLTYLKDKSLLRRLVRMVYLRRIAALCGLPTLDFGTGIGTLVDFLPAGSVGVDINPHAVAHGASLGRPLFAIPLEGPLQDRLRGVLSPQHKVFSAVHVLEHLDDPDGFMADLFRFADTESFRRLVLVVPGRKGFALDPTHRHFIDREFFRRVTAGTRWDVRSSRYFPFNSFAVANFFTHNELQVVLERRGAPAESRS